MKSYNVCLKDTVKTFTKKLFYSLFDCEQEKIHASYLEDIFLKILTSLEIDNGKTIWVKFKEQLPEIRKKLDLDALAFENNDPASYNLDEIYLAYPGFHAISIYRLSNALHQLQVPILPRMMSEYIHGITGIDIHPGATIGDSFYIDHGTGIVIGETAIIKNNVKIYQGVTLGGILVSKDLAKIKRHPTIENNVCIYANATILGGDIVIGENSIIGANVWITQSVPKDAVVSYKTEIKIRPKNNGI